MVKFYALQQRGWMLKVERSYLLQKSKRVYYLQINLSERIYDQRRNLLLVFQRPFKKLYLMWNLIVWIAVSNIKACSWCHQMSPSMRTFMSNFLNFLAWKTSVVILVLFNLLYCIAQLFLWIAPSFRMNFDMVNYSGFVAKRENSGQWYMHSFQNVDYSNPTLYFSEM